MSDGCDPARWAENKERTKGASPSGEGGYIPDLDKDISFLKEMLETFEKADGGNYGCHVAMDHLGVMIRDWLHELEKAKIAQPPPCAVNGWEKEIKT